MALVVNLVGEHSAIDFLMNAASISANPCFSFTSIFTIWTLTSSSYLNSGAL